MKQTVLIVDDQAVNRRILARILSDTYDLLEADDGRTALRVLEEKGPSVDAVLLDLVMPNLDGFGVLDAIKAHPRLSGIPVIVTTQAEKDEAEEKALAHGAEDFVSKPYNASVLRKRLHNLISLHRSTERIQRIERDELTGLYTKDAFCQNAAQRLAGDPAGEYLIVVTNVEKFKLINDSFGAQEGDRLLQFMARRLTGEMAAVGGICGRMMADRFIALVPRSVDDGELHSVVEQAQRDFADYPLNTKISVKFGVYPVEERELPITLMCDRAMLAANSIRGQYNCACAYYNDTIRQSLLKERQITDSMREALEQGQFCIYLQPKYDLNSECIAGAEALARWIHPQFGFMNPGEFIPLFERNGFITELDRFIWDGTCGLIEEWMRVSGRAVPVSVNVSRRDIYQENLPNILMEIVKKHGLEPRQLHLEITETAYTENPEQLISVVGALKKLGFVIEMDDFGSGYSSLNMLSALPIDILKLDMRFIQQESDRRDSKNILSFIISLAKWMNLLVIAEGVETQEQIDFLRNMDCNYVQGYYFAKPMSSADFSRLIATEELAESIPAMDKDWNVGSVRESGQTGDRMMLIVDDQETNRAILAELFKKYYTIVEADNGKVAFQYIRQHYDKIAVILLDLIMPVMDGFQVLEKLRENPFYAEIPVIVTSQAGQTSETRAFELGASDFLPKPYNLEVALHRVQNAVAHSAMQMLEQEKRMMSRMHELAAAAKSDPLTGLFNRSEMERQVDAFFAGGEKGRAIFLMLDIDNFKTINDLYGHDRGDEALCRVAERLRSLFRKEDLICRMGGDEFVVFITMRPDTAHFLNRLDRIRMRLHFSIEETEISCSIGICLAPENGSSYQELYHNADRALLTAKRMGKNRCQVYGESDQLPETILYRNLDWLLDETSDVVLVCDAETYELYYLNDMACRLAGKDRGVCLGKPCYEAIWNRSSPCAHCIPIGEMTKDYCERIVHPESSPRSYAFKGKLISWGKRLSRIQYAQDDTNRAALMQRLREISADRQTMLDLLPGGMLRYGAATDQLSFYSENLLHMLQYSREEFEEKFHRHFSELVYEEDRDRALHEIHRQIAQSGCSVCDYRIQRRDGSFCWAHNVGRLYEGEFYVILVDVSEQKRMERENDRLLRQLKTVINNVPGAVCLYSWNGSTLQALQVGSHFSQLFGISAEQALLQAGNLLTEQVYPADFAEVRALTRRLLFEGKPMDHVFRVANGRGAYRWLRMQAERMLLESGETQVCALYTDVTELYRLKAEIRHQQVPPSGPAGTGADS
ncbi:MAG: EAL domain-containing protein [Oscillibacter sp.]|jgi:diguanylate cyclase (GGDEF)-like protein|nr:EAL domain-containing protein [Oscillibacter sp.]